MLDGLKLALKGVPDRKISTAKSRKALKAFVLGAVAMAFALGLPVDAIAGPAGSIYNPQDYTALETSLEPTTSVEFFTGAGSQDDASDLWYRVDSSAEGDKVSAGVVELNESGNVEMAVFTFDEIDIGSGVSVTVTGNRGLVLASRNTFVFNTTINVAGGDQPSGNGAATAGGPGGAGSNLTTGNNPPPSNGGNGSGGGTGIGPGGGTYDGTGGGYGGIGGGDANRTMNAPTYGNKELTDLYGGSGGGGGVGGSGTGGGGSLELVASISLELGSSARIYIDGGDATQVSDTNGNKGGGGSGGGLILGAVDLTVNSSAQIDAGGGRGQRRGASGNSGYTGGGGGGGRVAWYYDTLVYGGNRTTRTLGDGSSANVPNMIDIERGDNPQNHGFSGTPPARGTFYEGDFPHIIPPAGTVFIVR